VTVRASLEEQASPSPQVALASTGKAAIEVASPVDSRLGSDKVQPTSPQVQTPPSFLTLLQELSAAHFREIEELQKEINQVRSVLQEEDVSSPQRQKQRQRQQRRPVAKTLAQITASALQDFEDDRSGHHSLHLEACTNSAQTDSAAKSVKKVDFSRSDEIGEASDTSSSNEEFYRRPNTKERTELRYRLSSKLANMPLCVIIERATDLPNADVIGKSDPYCICEIVNQPNMRFQTRTISNNLNPVWNHKFVLPGLDPSDELRFTVMDEDFRDDELLGVGHLLGHDVAAGFAGEVPLILNGKETAARLRVTIKVPGADLEGSSFVLWPTWVDEKPAIRLEKLASRPSLENWVDQPDSAKKVLAEGAYDITLARSWGILHPEGAQRLTWDVLGLFILLLDLIWLPMQVFDPPETTLVQCMGWLTLLYWTGDIIASCSTGFYTQEGGIVMTRHEVLIRYARSWMILDLPLMTIDWGVTIGELVQSQTSQVDGAGVARSAKLVRITRSARLLRLMRLMKLRKVLFTVENLIASEWLTLVMAVVKNLCTILAINHILACVWFWLGAVGGEEGWVSQHRLTDEDFGHQYFISLHWSLAQFTPGATPIHPHSLAERFMAVLVLAVGLVIATCFVSSITSTMASVWTANRYNSTQHLLLKKFLMQNKISRGVSSRITHYVDFMLELRSKRVHISKVAFLSFLSGPLNIELQTELFSPILMSHPCFSQIALTSKPVMREICTTAVEGGTQNYAKNDMLFQVGKEAKQLLFLTLGTLIYRFKPEESETTFQATVSTGSWCVEAALWMPWHHVGEMQALVEADIVSVKVAKFREICEASPQVFPVARGYALNFWQETHENEQAVLTDIGFNFTKQTAEKQISTCSTTTGIGRKEAFTDWDVGLSACRGTLR